MKNRYLFKRKRINNKLSEMHYKGRLKRRIVKKKKRNKSYFREKSWMNKGSDKSMKKTNSPSRRNLWVAEEPCITITIRWALLEVEFNNNSNYLRSINLKAPSSNQLSNICPLFKRNTKRTYLVCNKTSQWIILMVTILRYIKRQKSWILKINRFQNYQTW